MENYEDEPKKPRPKPWLWIAVGVVAIAVTIAVVAATRGGATNASELTLEEVNAVVEADHASVRDLLTWKATATEQLANLAKARDWSSDINAIRNEMRSDLEEVQADVAELKESYENIQEAVGGTNVSVPRYAMVSLMLKYEGPRHEWQGHVFTNIEVYGGGAYPVVVTFYGKDLGDSTVYPPENPPYRIRMVSQRFEYSLVRNSTSVNVVGVGGNVTLNLTECKLVPNCVELVVYVTPDTEWADSDTIRLGIDPKGGSIEYATAVVGGTCLLPNVPTPGDWPV